MARKCVFAVKEYLWRQAYPVDPTNGLTLYATVLEDEAGRRLIVYADADRRTEAFEPDGTPIAVTTTPCTTGNPSCEKVQFIRIGGDPVRCAVTKTTAAVAREVKTCIKYGADGTPRKVPCPPWKC